MFFTRPEDFKTIYPLGPGIQIRIIWGKEIMMSIATIAAGLTTPEGHNHYYEQAGIIIDGAGVLSVGDDKQECRLWDGFLAPSNTVHGAVVEPEKPCKLVEIFSPIRDDYINFKAAD